MKKNNFERKNTIIYWNQYKDKYDSHELIKQQNI